MYVYVHFGEAAAAVVLNFSSCCSYCCRLANSAPEGWLATPNDDDDNDFVPFVPNVNFCTTFASVTFCPGINIMADMTIYLFARHFPPNAQFRGGQTDVWAQTNNNNKSENNKSKMNT